MNQSDHRLVELEADEIVATYGAARDAADLESLAAGTLEHPGSYDGEPAFARRVAAELRRRAAALRREAPGQGSLRLMQ